MTGQKINEHLMRVFRRNYKTYEYEQGNPNELGRKWYLSLSEHFLEETQHLRHIQLNVLEVKEMLVVFLLKGTQGHQLEGYRGVPWQPTFSNKSSMLRSISRIAFSLPL